MKEFKINEQELDSIFKYLISKPFVEVAGLINIIQRLPVIGETNTVSVKTKVEKEK